MANPGNIISDLIGTARTFFRFPGWRLKDTSGVAEVRNEADTAYARLNASVIGVAGSNASNKVVLQAPADLAGNVTLTLPDGGIVAGYFLSTDADGNLSFAPGSSSSELTWEESFTEATSSPMTIFTPPANATILEVDIYVDVAAAGGSPTICVGVAGTTQRDVQTTDVDLKMVANYKVSPGTEVGGSPAAMIATIVPSSQTFSGRIIVKYAIPSS